MRDDLVQPRLTATRRNEIWLTDITERHTGEGKSHRCAIKDLRCVRQSKFPDGALSVS